MPLLTACPSGGDEGEGNDETADTLYDRLGGEEGIQAVVQAAVVNRIAADPKINAYFLNSSVDVGIVIGCLTDQLGNLTGGPQEYPNANCRDMKTSHEGLGISDNDFNDLAGHFVAELTERGVSEADIQTIVDALTGMHDDIVEDADGTATVYQRVGRQPAIQTVVTNFVDLVVADPTLMAFFAATDRDRLEGCLVRQVCGIDGPCEYGFEVPDLQPVFAAGVCRDMISSHEGIVITIEDFSALVGHLITAMTDAGVTQADQDAITGVLGPLCADIVTDPATCP
ncbi:group I truncated hemoglobin [Nannocystaceae bacterium ST9]